MELYRRFPAILTFFTLLISVMVLAACQSTLVSYRGRTALQEDRIPLIKGKMNEGTWQTRDLAVNYCFQQNSPTIRISGSIRLEDYLVYNFTTLEHLYLHVNFLDTDGNVLESKLVFASNYRQMIREMAFEQTLSLPPGTTGLSFGYDGTVIEGGGGSGGEGDEVNGGTSWDFWKAPGRPLSN